MNFARFLITVVCLLALSLVATAAQAIAPVAGTQIENRAALFHATASGAGQVGPVQSNSVFSVVQASEGVSLSAAQDVAVTSGAAAVVSHRVVNTGNVATTFVLVVANQGGDDIDLSSLRVVRDLNGNGTIDAGEPTVDVISLAANETADLIIEGIVPTASAGARARVLLRVTSSGANAQVIDTLTVGQPVALQITQSASTLNPVAGQRVTLRVRLANVGGSAAGVTSFSVNGVMQQAVLLVLPISDDTTVDSAGGADSVLYHIHGASSMVFVSQMPADRTLIDGVVFVFHDLTAGEIADVWATAVIRNNVVGMLSSTAWAFYQDPMTGMSQMASNEVELEVAGLPAQVTYYNDAGYTQPAQSVAVGGTLMVQVAMNACNVNPAMAETIPVTIRGLQSRDVETVQAVETGPDTGIFEISGLPTINLLQRAVTNADGMLEISRGEQISAEAVDCGGDHMVWAQIDADRTARVFDSQTGKPVAGATVQLVGYSASFSGGASIQSANDAIAPSAVTGDDGQFSFPYMGAGTYRITVTPPADYVYPSKVAPAQLKGAYLVDANSSYGLQFTLTSATSAVAVDIPVDPLADNALQVEHEARRTTAELGDFVDFSITVRNISGSRLPDVWAMLDMPRGFVYQVGSLRIDGLGVADPEGRGPSLRFGVGSMDVGAVVKLTYRTRVGPGVQLGRVTSRAYARNSEPVRQSSTALAAVTIEGGVFDTKGFVLGRVFADCNANGLQDDGEPGIPGVRIWMEDGTWAMTDGQGKYSLYGISARTHVLKLDGMTLPAGTQGLATSQRHGGDGNSRFVDMKNGELDRADFPLSGCGPALTTEIARRVQAQVQYAAAIEGGDLSALTLDAAAVAQTAQAAGTVRGGANTVTAPNANPNAVQGAPAAKGAAAPQTGDWLTAQDASFDIVGLADGATLNGLAQNLRIKGPSGSAYILYVNDQIVAGDRLGAQMIDQARGVQGMEYVGVPFRAGRNIIRVVRMDGTGAQAGEITRQVFGPGKLARVVLATEPDLDHPELMRVGVSLLDEEGRSMGLRTVVTLESNGGQWLAQDLDMVEAGTQVAVEGGRGTFVLRMPDAGGDVRVRVGVGNLQDERTVNAASPLRDMIATGLVEGMLNLRNLGAGAITGADRRDGFEDEITHFAWGSSDGKREAAARAALFLKGKVRGDYLLTLGYDSDKDTQARLFRDIQPDRYYPVYGDSSLKGFDAQSSGHLYVRVDSGKSWLLWGDLLTSSTGMDAARNLSAYNRTLNGLRHHYENGIVRADTFASRDNTRQMVEEIPANGTSGPYMLRFGNVLANSERIEILTRDRRDASLIVKNVVLARFTDYEIEPFSGRILMRAPVPSVDSELNNNSIRITYEVEQGGAKFWVAGTDVRVKVLDNDKVRAEVGGVLVEDRNPQDRASMQGANVSVNALGMSLVAEHARTDKDSVGSGKADRFEVRKEDGDFRARVYAGRADKNFDNASATLNRGKSNWGAKLSYALSEDTRFVVDALGTRDEVLGTTRRDALFGVEQIVARDIKVELGVHQFEGRSTQSAELARDETTSVRARISSPVPGLPAASVFGEAEQAMGDSARRMLAAGGEYRLANRARIYGRYEFASSLASYVDNDTQRRNTAVLGIDANYMEDGRAFSEYRARDAFSGREAEAAMGLRNQWKLAKGVAVNTSFERVHVLQRAGDAASTESTAVTGAVEYTVSPDVKATGRLEFRVADTSNSMLNTLGLAARLNAAWTFLGRNILSVIDNKGAGQHVQDRFQLGLAYREMRNNSWYGLGRYEYNIERDGNPLSPFRHSAHVVSVHANVQATRALIITGRYAGKIASDESYGLTSHSSTHLLSARATYDIAAKWDIGVQASTLFTPGGRSRQYGVGAEVGYMLDTNLWVSAGYNVMGFSDRDLTVDESMQRGVYVRMRFKFDEKLFDQLGGRS
ncbi:MAG: hypothetical protein QM639_13810 [Rhodocyclaceae bacterium]